MCQTLSCQIISIAISWDFINRLTRVDDAVDENFARYQAVVVLVHLAEQISEARLFVVHEFQELQRECKQSENVKKAFS